MDSYVSVGCFKIYKRGEKGKSHRHAIPSVERNKHPEFLNTQYANRIQAIRLCYEYAKRRSFRFFAISNGGMCRTSAIAGHNYNRFGRSDGCDEGSGKGGATSMHVYKIAFDLTRTFAPIGCYGNISNFQSLEGKDPEVTGPLRMRSDRVMKCFRAAKRQGYTRFAMRKMGLCYGSRDTNTFYASRANHTQCNPTGRGTNGTRAQVYAILGKCF